MKNASITRYKSDHPRVLTAKERARLDRMSDKQVHAAALSDPDARPLTDRQLRGFQRSPSIRAIRDRLHLTQKQFAEKFGLSLPVVRDWEQGRFPPDQAARTLLKVIDANPEAVSRALS